MFLRNEQLLITYDLDNQGSISAVGRTSASNQSFTSRPPSITDSDEEIVSLDRGGNHFICSYVTFN